MKTVPGLLPATVNGKPVKNLGWMLRNWQDIRSIAITPHPPIAGGGLQPDAVLTAIMRDGRKYETGFSDAGILERFLDRPVFRGLPIIWRIAIPSGKPDDNFFKSWTFEDLDFSSSGGIYTFDNPKQNPLLPYRYFVRVGGGYRGYASKANAMAYFKSE